MNISLHSDQDFILAKECRQCRDVEAVDTGDGCHAGYCIPKLADMAINSCSTAVADTLTAVRGYGETISGCPRDCPVTGDVYPHRTQASLIETASMID